MLIDLRKLLVVFVRSQAMDLRRAIRGFVKDVMDEDMMLRNVRRFQVLGMLELLVVGFQVR